MSSLSFRFLGPPSIERDGVSVVLARHKSVASLAYLTVTGRSHDHAEAAVEPTLLGRLLAHHARFVLELGSTLCNAGALAAAQTEAGASTLVLAALVEVAEMHGPSVFGRMSDALAAAWTTRERASRMLMVAGHARSRKATPAVAPASLVVTMLDSEGGASPPAQGGAPRRAPSP